MTARMLRYSIRDECLYGAVSGVRLPMKAYSGGGRGGPIPVGVYLASYHGAHPRLGLCARLDRTRSSPLQADGDAPIGFVVAPGAGFYIHGATAAGSEGSDGCIVPARERDLAQLLAAIASSAAPVLLMVHGDTLAAGAG